MLPAVMIFGKHKDVPFGEIPTSYLLWLGGQRNLDFAVRAATLQELARRRVAPPALQPPRPLIRCPAHPVPEPRLVWIPTRAGRRIRSRCSVCNRFLGFAQIAEPYCERATHNTTV
jgi:hypothetical protein